MGGSAIWVKLPNNPVFSFKAPLIIFNLLLPLLLLLSLNSTAAMSPALLYILMRTWLGRTSPLAKLDKIRRKSLMECSVLSRSPGNLEHLEIDIPTVPHMRGGSGNRICKMTSIEFNGVR